MWINSELIAFAPGELNFWAKFGWFFATCFLLFFFNQQCIHLDYVLVQDQVEPCRYFYRLVISTFSVTHLNHIGHIRWFSDVQKSALSSAQITLWLHRHFLGSAMLGLCLHELTCTAEAGGGAFLLLRNALTRPHVRYSSFQMGKKKERKMAKLP